MATVKKRGVTIEYLNKYCFDKAIQYCTARIFSYSEIVEAEIA